LHQIAGRVELQHRRRSGTALSRLHLDAFLVLIERRRAAMNDPDVVALIYPHPDGRPQYPVIWQRFRPERIDFKSWRSNGTAPLLCLHGPLQNDFGDGQQPNRDDEDRSNQQLTSCHLSPRIRCQSG
jgi:hypothetical protein